MIKIWLFIVIATDLSAQGWHVATKAECHAEFERELRAMSEAGWCCDPPISMGHFSGTLGKHPIGYGETPCGYTNGDEFRSRFSIWAGTLWPHVKHCEVSEDQYRLMWVRDPKRSKPGIDYVVFSNKRFKALARMCKSGKLPVIQEDQQ